eukprot:scaffold205776_cov43-Prasinocladus_malaysianus.AAC.1
MGHIVALKRGCIQNLGRLTILLDYFFMLPFPNFPILALPRVRPRAVFAAAEWRRRSAGALPGLLTAGGGYSNTPERPILTLQRTRGHQIAAIRERPCHLPDLNQRKVISSLSSIVPFST